MTLLQFLLVLIVAAILLGLGVLLLDEPYRSTVLGIGFIVLLAVMAVAVLLGIDSIRKH